MYESHAIYRCEYVLITRAIVFLQLPLRHREERICGVCVCVMGRFYYHLASWLAVKFTLLLAFPIDFLRGIRLHSKTTYLKSGDTPHTSCSNLNACQRDKPLTPGETRAPGQLAH